MANLMIYD